MTTLPGPALTVWTAPRVHVSVALAVLRTRDPKVITYIAPGIGEAAVIRVEPGHRLDTVAVIEADRRDDVALIAFDVKDGERLILFACRMCGHGSESVYLRALDPVGLIIAPGPRCQVCARLVDVDGLGPAVVDGTAVIDRDRP